jgi:alanyl-tRNA synthetase
VQEFVQSCNSGSDVVGLVLDKTPLYAEQGGQIFDKDCPLIFLIADAHNHSGYFMIFLDD